MDLASFLSRIRHVFADTFFSEAILDSLHCLSRKKVELNRTKDLQKYCEHFFPLGKKLSPQELTIDAIHLFKVAGDCVEQLGNLLRMRQFGPSCTTRIYFARVAAGALNS